MNRGEKPVSWCFKEALKLDPSLSRASFYRWAETQDKDVKELEAIAKDQALFNNVKDNLVKRKYLTYLMELGLTTLSDPEAVLSLSPKDKLTLAVQAARTVQMEEQLIVADSHHKEEIDYKREILSAAAKPDIVIEDRRRED